MAGLTVLLISGNSETSPSPVYPLALARLAGALERAGHRTRQYDLLAHGAADLPRMIEEAWPDLIGISIRNVDNADAGAPRSYVSEYQGLVEQVRSSQMGRVPIVLGGAGFSLFPRKFMALLGAQFGVVGPGEHTLCGLCDTLAGGRDVSSVPGLLIADQADASAPGDSAAPMFSTMSHDPDIVRYYWREGGMIGIQTRCGCPKNCSYCSYPLIEGHDVRWGDPVSLADEMERMAKNWDVRYFFMADSIFNLCPERELALADEIRRRSLDISWGAFFAPTPMDRDYLGALKASGLKHVEFGTDSLCDAMLRSYAKDFTVEQALEVSTLCSQMGLYCAHYIILGGPGECEETIAETVRNAARLRGCVFFPFVGVRLYPGTPLYSLAPTARDDAQARRSLDEGGPALRSPREGGFEPLFYFADGLDGPTIWSLLPRHGQGGMRQWIVPSRSSALAATVRRMRERGMKGPLWEFLLGGHARRSPREGGNG